MAMEKGTTQVRVAALPADDLARTLTVARPETDAGLEHIGVVGDTYTLLLTGRETAGRFCLIDMHIPPGGGPPPHRHDFEETFVLLEGEIEATFRGETVTVRAGETAARSGECAASVPKYDNGLRCVCYVSARRRGRRTSFARLGCQWRSGRRRHRSWMGQGRRHF